MAETSLPGNSGKLSWRRWIFLYMHGLYRLSPQDMVALRLGQGDSGPCTFLARVATAGLRGEACRQRTGLAALHGRLVAGPRAPPEALRHVLALQLLRFPAICQLLLPGPVCAGLWDIGLGFRRSPSSPRLEAPDCLCGLQLGLVLGLPHPTSNFSSQVSAVCTPSAHVRPAASRLPKAPPSLPKLREVGFWGIHVAFT